MDTAINERSKPSVVNILTEIVWRSLSLLPLNFISYLVGWLSRIELPEKYGDRANRLFVRLFNIDISEASGSLESYKSIEDIFTRTLKPGLRPIEGNVCSPADGHLVLSQPADNNTALQAKGHTYHLSELVFGCYDKRCSLSWFSTVYLAPHNYHRVHSPVTGELMECRYFPGELWPVNQPFVKFVPRLFVRNERLVFSIRLTSGGMVYVVMVGALNVGRIVTPFIPGFSSNSLNSKRGRCASVFIEGLPRKLEIGDELGTFMLGSTVVVVFDKEAEIELGLSAKEAVDIRMGNSLGRDL